MINLLLINPTICDRQTNSRIHVVNLKLDVSTMNETSDSCNIFNRSDYITICYNLTNTREDNNAIAKTIIIYTNISNILEPPKERITLSDITTSNPGNNNDGRGFSIECSIFRNKANRPNDECEVDSVFVDPEGQFRVIVNNLHPERCEFVCINYSTKISKKAYVRNFYNCSDIKQSDIHFNGSNLDLRVEEIYINGIQPQLQWNITPQEQDDIIGRNISDNLTYKLHNNTLMVLSGRILDLGFVNDNASIIICETYNNNTTIVADSNCSINQTVLINGVGIHKFNATVVEDGIITLEENKSYNFEVIADSKDDIVPKPNIDLEEQMQLNILNVFYIFDISIILCGLFIWLPYFNQNPDDKRSKPIQIILRRDFNFVIIVILLIILLLIYFNECESNVFLLNYLYRFEIPIYTIVFISSLLYINWKSNSKQNKSEENKEYKNKELTWTWTAKIFIGLTCINHIIFYDILDSFWSYLLQNIAYIASICYIYMRYNILPRNKPPFYFINKYFLRLVVIFTCAYIAYKYLIQSEGLNVINIILVLMMEGIILFIILISQTFSPESLEKISRKI